MRNTRGFIGTLTIIVVGICIIFLVLAVAAQRLPTAVGGEGKGAFLSGGSKDFVSEYGTKSNPLVDFLDGTSGRAQTGGDLPGSSTLAGKVTLQTTGVRSTQPHEEYVVIKNGSGSSVDITGWKLTNGKGTRPIENNTNDYFYPTPDTVTIGQGAEFLDPDAKGSFRVGSIVLRPGDSAIVTTGGPFTQFSYSIPVSFRENICVGYLDVYPFVPSLPRQCPLIEDEPGVNAMTDPCYDYISRIGRCTDPTKKDKARFEEQTSICRNFISIRSNYSGCVRDHKNDANFYSKQWRVFLGQKKELWASSREVITLYDKSGNVVDRVTY